MNLLPEQLEKARMNLPVADSLPAKGFGHKTAIDRLRTIDHLYRRTDVFGHITIAPDESYALTDKTSPHALYELMVISAGRTQRPGLHDHSPQFGRALGVMAASFADRCHTYDLTPVVSWSYDPATTDRESIQGEKRFHAHLVGRTDAERAIVRAKTAPAHTLTITRARRIVEEASVLGSLLAQDCIDPDALHVLTPVPALSTPTATATAQFRLPEGWNSLTHPALHDDLAYIHRKLRRTYDEITRTATTGTTGTWQRPTLRPFDPDTLNLPLRPDARAALTHYLRALRPELLTGQAASSRARATHVYPLADLAYAVTIAEQNGGVYLHVRTNVFSDLGGAGIGILDGTIVKTKKGIGTLHGHEIAARKAFQTEYLRNLQSHPQAMRALFPRV